MIQILGLRQFTDKETGEVKLYDSHFNNGWRAPSVQELFTNLDSYIEQIPEDQRWNMFYTVNFRLHTHLHYHCKNNSTMCHFHPTQFCDDLVISALQYAHSL